MTVKEKKEKSKRMNCLKEKNKEKIKKEKNKKLHKTNNFKELLLSALFLITESIQQRAPTLTPSLVTEGKSTDASWNNADSAAYLSVGLGSRLGNTNLVVFTSYNPSTTTGHSVTMYDSSAATIAPVLSNIGGGYEVGFSNAGSTAGKAYDSGAGATKFVVIDIDSASSRTLKVFQNSGSNQPTFVKTLPALGNLARALYYYESTNFLVVAADGGIFTINTDSGTTYTSITDLAGDNYLNIVRSISSTTTNDFFTIGSTSKILKVFDATTGVVSGNVVTSPNQATAIAQSSKTNAKILLALNYDDGGKNFHYIQDYATDAITATFTFTPNTGTSVGYKSLWNIPQTDMFYAAIGTKVYLVDITYSKILTTDATSNFVNSANSEVVTTMIFLEETETLVVAGYQGTSYAFIKKYTFFDDCDSTCLTCSIAKDPKLCLTCPSSGTQYFYQNDPAINNIYCLTEAQCQNADNYYTDKTDNTCLSSQECNAESKFYIEETQDCVASCSTPYDYELNGKECLKALQCQDRYNHYTRNDSTPMTCITKSDCTGASYYTIEDWSDCLTACPSGATDIHKWKWEATKTCYTAAECQIPGTSYTYNVSNLCETAANCVTPKFRIEEYGDCVDDCTTLTPPRYKITGSELCYSGYECQTIQGKYTNNDTYTCTDACGDPRFAVELWKDCVAACNVAETLDHKWQDGTNFKCKTAKQCQATLFTKNTTSSTTEGTCVSQTDCTTATFDFISDYNDCIATCKDHSTHTLIDEANADQCITIDQCKQRTDGWHKATDPPECVLAASCTDPYFKVHETRECVNGCAAKSQFALATSNDCLTESECKQLTTASQHYIDNDLNKCIEKAACTTASKFTIESQFTCVTACGVTGFEAYKFVNSGDRTCFSEEECEAAQDSSSNDLYSYDNGSGTTTCVKLADCIVLPAFIIPELRKCVPTCLGTEASINYTYIDKSANADSNTATDDTCITEEACITRADGFRDMDNKICYTAAECLAASRYTTSDRKCVGTCPTGTYIYKDDLTTPTLQKCITAAECKEITSPSQHFIVDDSTNAGAMDKTCIPDTRCTDAVAPLADWYLVEDTNKCVMSCQDGTDSKYQYADATDKKCYSKNQCKTHKTSTALDRFYWDETTPYACYTETECTTANKLVEETRECFSTCAASTDYPYQIQDAPTKCVSKNGCISDSSYGFVRDEPDPKECVSAAQCFTATSYTTPDGRCSSTCPTDFSESLFAYTTASVKQCITAEECIDILTPDQHLTVVFGTEDGNCVSSTYCTGTLSGKIYVNKSQCAQDCASTTDAPYLTTDNKCYSEAECKLLDNGSGTLTHLVDKTAMTCETEAECIGAKYSITSIRECATTCAATSYIYVEATGSKNCINATLCGAKTDGYTHDVPDPKICLTAAECFAASSFTVEEDSTCLATCPSGEYQYSTASTKSCVTAPECTNMAGFYTKNSTNECVDATGCTGASGKLLEDWKDCLTTCDGHPTHDYEDGNYCVTGIECQLATGKYTLNSTTPKTCVDLTTCTASNKAIDYYSDCVSACESATALQPLYLESTTSKCLTVIDCQSTTDRYTWNDTTTKECLSKADCKVKTGYVVEEYNDCVAACPSPGGDPYFLKYDDGSVLECLDTQACKAKANYYTYDGATPNECILNTVCTGTHSRFPDPATKECKDSCSNGLYKDATTSACVTASECAGLTRYANDATFECIDKTACDSAGRYTLTNNYFCMGSCPSGYYKYDTDHTCITALACKGNSRYTFNKTDTEAAACIDEATCTSTPRVKIETSFYWDCACPTDKPYWEFSTKTCVTATECAAMTDRYTHNTTNSCISSEVCKNQGSFIIEQWRDCISSCTATEAADHNLLRVELGTCLTEQLCKSDTANPYVDATNNKCLTKSECTAQNYVTVESEETCLSACSTHATKTFTGRSDRICYTPAECAILAGRYTKNDTSECVNKVECSTNNFKTIEDWSDCLATCPVTAGSHEFLNDTASTCLTAEQCTATWYTKNDSRNCIPVEVCETISYLKIDDFKDCVATCAGHPTHKYHSKADDTCITAAICQSKADGYTSNSTNKCLTETECLSIPNKIITSYHDCTVNCPVIGYYLKDSTHCLTQAECKTAQYYSNQNTLLCTQNCPEPLFHDLQGFTCITQCPTGYIALETERKCYTPEECIALSSDHWVYPDAKVCRETCTLFKDESQRNCIPQNECSDKSLTDISKCYTEITITPINLVTTTTTVENTNGNGENSTVTSTVVERSDDNKIVIPIKLNIVLSEGNQGIIEKIEYIIIKELQTRILQENTITSFEMVPGTNSGEYLIKFDAPVKDKFTANVVFKKGFQIYQQSSGDKFPKLYQVDASDLKVTIPGVVKEDKFTIGEGITMIFDGAIKIVPIIGNAINMISGTRIFPFVSQDYNRIVAYNRATSLNIRKETLRDKYNQTFIDWSSSLNKMIATTIDEEFVTDDLLRVCEKDIESKSCYSRYSSNIFINKSTVLALIVILTVFIMYRRIRLGLLPIVTYSFQLFLLLDFAYNISFPEFRDNLQTIGLAVSCFGLMLILGKFFHLILNNDYGNIVSKNDIFNNLYYGIFISKEKMGEFFVIRFILDALITITIIIFKNSPKTQGLILLLIEAITVGTSFMKHFAHSALKIRQILINILFLALSIINLFLALSSKAETNGLDFSAHFISWAIIGVEVIFIIVAFNVLGYKEDEPYTEKKRTERELKYRSTDEEKRGIKSHLDESDERLESGRSDQKNIRKNEMVNKRDNENEKLRSKRDDIPRGGSIISSNEDVNIKPSTDNKLRNNPRYR